MLLKKDIILAKTFMSTLSSDKNNCWYGLAGGLGFSGLVAGWLSEVDAAAFEAFLESSPEGLAAAVLSAAEHTVLLWVGAVLA